eukprot:1180961-Prorocentrum_minimum.AAC.5
MKFHIVGPCEPPYCRSRSQDRPFLHPYLPAPSSTPTSDRQIKELLDLAAAAAPAAPAPALQGQVAPPGTSGQIPPLVRTLLHTFTHFHRVLRRSRALARPFGKVARFSGFSEFPDIRIDRLLH